MILEALFTLFRAVRKGLVKDQFAYFQGILRNKKQESEGRQQNTQPDYSNKTTLEKLTDRSWDI